MAELEAFTPVLFVVDNQPMMQLKKDIVGGGGLQVTIVWGNPPPTTPSSPSAERVRSVSRLRDSFRSFRFLFSVLPIFVPS